MCKRDLRGCADWEWLTHALRPSALLIGPRGVTDAVLRDIQGSLRPPIFEWPRDGAPWNCAEPPATVILRQVAELSRDDQYSLLTWLSNGGRRVQVISVASRRVYPLVEAGAFLPALYYRINCVIVDCAGRNGRGRRIGT